jgi:hypothetical protein
MCSMTVGAAPRLASIFTAHDGSTLADLVSYTKRRFEKLRNVMAGTDGFLPDRAKSRANGGTIMKKIDGGQSADLSLNVALANLVIAT